MKVSEWREFDMTSRSIQNKHISKENNNKMKNVGTSINNSPKTPGGISKSLLTPCRRIGLSRKWRRNGAHPFVSPLSNTNNDNEIEIQEGRKRKERISENTVEVSKDIDQFTAVINSQTDITPHSEIATSRKTITADSQLLSTTPSRNIDTPRRKKSKISIDIDSPQKDIAIITQRQTGCKQNYTIVCEKTNEKLIENKTKSENILLMGGSQDNNGQKIDNNSENCITNITLNETKNNENTLIVSSPLKTKSKSKIYLTSNNRQITSKSMDKENSPTIEEKEDFVYAIKEKSPNDLMKECVVVIQKKLFKNMNNHSDNQMSKKDDVTKIFDIEEDEPLIKLKKQNSAKADLVEDDDFIEIKSDRIKSVKLKTTKSPKLKIKSTKLFKSNDKVVVKQTHPSQSINNNDDDDDDFNNKKTIIIKRSYEKVSKPTKSKSTGSISQRDIDNIRNRIETKKKLLLAQSLTPDTEELRSLIKKWQKGCQDALIELLDLMKNKFPDKERMDYSEMLKTLKIPPSLVGYDSDNDCFHSPDDASIILGQFNDL